MVPVVNIVTEVVQKVSVAITPYLQTINNKYEGVRFDYGHPADIIAKIVQFGPTEENRFKKYPLIGLFLDFPQTRGVNNETETRVKLSMFICIGTQANYTPQQRTQQSFVPILIPIYDELMKQFLKHNAVIKPENLKIPHEYVERYQWGKGGLEYYDNGKKNVFNDFIDAIELINLELDLKNIC